MGKTGNRPPSASRPRRAAQGRCFTPVERMMKDWLTRADRPAREAKCAHHGRGTVVRAHQTIRIKCRRVSTRESESVDKGIVQCCKVWVASPCRTTPRSTRQGNGMRSVAFRWPKAHETTAGALLGLDCSWLITGNTIRMYANTMERRLRR